MGQLRGLAHVNQKADTKRMMLMQWKSTAAVCRRRTRGTLTGAKRTPPASYAAFSCSGSDEGRLLVRRWTVLSPFVAPDAAAAAYDFGLPFAVVLGVLPFVKDALLFCDLC